MHVKRLSCQHFTGALSVFASGRATYALPVEMGLINPVIRPLP